MKRIGVMQVIDSLEAGGAERVAVNLANLLPRKKYQTYLCSTRKDGPLSDSVADDVVRLRLERKSRFDLKAAQHLVAFIKTHDIKILHAHSTSLFIAVLASLFPPYPAVIWHAHFGRYAMENRRGWLYGLAGFQVGGVLAVNDLLVEWVRRRLPVPHERVWYLPNFVSRPKGKNTPAALPGQRGKRIVCVANLRPEKDHPTLIRAMSKLVKDEPAAHLLLVGAASNQTYFRRLQEEVTHQGVKPNVSFLGQRHDVSGILADCDIGVLSSTSEGFPLALIEYGMARLPVVATRVGQCPEVLDGGQAGLLVHPQEPEELAGALLSLLNSSERRAELGEGIHQRVQRFYNADSVIDKVCSVYDSVLGQRGGDIG